MTDEGLRFESLMVRTSGVASADLYPHAVIGK